MPTAVNHLSQLQSETLYEVRVRVRVRVSVRVRVNIIHILNESASNGKANVTRFGLRLRSS